MTGSTDMTGAVPSRKKEKNRPDRYIGNFLLPLSILLFAMICLYQAFDFPGGDGEVGPAGVPYLWISFSTFFCLVLMVQAGLKKLKPDPVPGNIRFVVLFSCGLVVYLIAIENAGYYVSTFLFIVVSMYALGYRRYPIMIGVALGWLLFSYTVFAQLLYIPLPEGPLMKLLVG